MRKVMSLKCKKVRRIALQYRLPSFYNSGIMRKTIVIWSCALVCLAGCNKSTPSAASSPATPASGAPSTAASSQGGMASIPDLSGGAKTGDSVRQKLEELAGAGATNCGRLSSQADSDLKAASDCATQAVQKKHPFWVAYDMPGMSVGVAGNSAGKLFTAQAEGTNGLASGACPSQMRIAPSGRITCFAPGDMGSMGGGHGGMNAVPPGTKNPHGGTQPVGKPQ
jgi:hypothetical protein